MSRPIVPKAIWFWTWPLKKTQRALTWNVPYSAKNVTRHASHNKVLRSRTRQCGRAPGSVLPCAEGERGFQKSSSSPFSFQVTLCSNTVQQYELALVVDVDGIGEEVLALLITARYRARCFSLPSLPRVSGNGPPVRKAAAGLPPGHPALCSAFLGKEAESDIQMTKL